MQHFIGLTADNGRRYWLNEAHITFVAATTAERPAKGFLVGVIGLPKPVRFSGKQEMEDIRKMMIDKNA